MIHLVHFVPAYRQQIRAGAAYTIGKTAHWCALHDLRWDFRYLDRSSIVRARNEALRDAYRVGADYLLMQDADCFVPGPQVGLEHLISAIAAGPSAAAGLVFPMRGKQDGTTNTSGSWRVGTGMMLIDLEAIAHLERPLFRFEREDDGITPIVGEDYHFCDRLHQAGLRVARVDDVPTAHCAETTLRHTP